jgi:nitroreductase
MINSKKLKRGSMNIEDYLELMKTRYSVRKYTDEQVTEEELSAILEAARLSPTAKNVQSFRLCVVQSEDGLAKIDECSKCRYGAQTAIIVAYDKEASCKGLGYETGDFGNIDASIVLTNMANAAAAAGLGSCMVGAYDAGMLRERFNVPQNYVLVDMLMIGHPAKDSQPSPRHDESLKIEELVVHEGF